MNSFRDSMDPTRILNVKKVVGNDVHCRVLFLEGKYGVPVYHGMVTLPKSLFFGMGKVNEQQASRYGFMPVI